MISNNLILADYNCMAGTLLIRKFSISESMHDATTNEVWWLHSLTCITDSDAFILIRFCRSFKSNLKTILCSFFTFHSLFLKEWNKLLYIMLLGSKNSPFSRKVRVFTLNGSLEWSGYWIWQCCLNICLWARSPIQWYSDAIRIPTFLEQRL